MTTRYSTTPLDLGELGQQDVGVKWNDEKVISVLFCGADVTTKIQDLGIVHQQVSDANYELIQGEIENRECDRYRSAS